MRCVRRRELRPRRASDDRDRGLVGRHPRRRSRPLARAPADRGRPRGRGAAREPRSVDVRVGRVVVERRGVVQRVHPPCHVPRAVRRRRVVVVAGHHRGVARRARARDYRDRGARAREPALPGPRRGQGPLNVPPLGADPAELPAGLLERARDLRRARAPASLAQSVVGPARGARRRRGRGVPGDRGDHLPHVVTRSGRDRRGGGRSRARARAAALGGRRSARRPASPAASSPFSSSRTGRT